MLHDWPHHLMQRWITYRRRLALSFPRPIPSIDRRTDIETASRVNRHPKWDPQSASKRTLFVARLYETIDVSLSSRADFA
jgi:hypothetical protein